MPKFNASQKEAISAPNRNILISAAAGSGKTTVMVEKIKQTLIDHPEADLSSMLAPAMANWQLKDVQLGLPFATSTTVTYYNKTVLEAAGFSAPQTLADVGALSSLNGDAGYSFQSSPL